MFVIDENLKTKLKIDKLDVLAYADKQYFDPA